MDIYFLEKPDLPPLCSVHIINHDRIWQEPWRFLTYGFVHNNWGHLLANIFSQLFFGIPLELTHGWLRVAMIYISGIVLGGLGREMLSEHNERPLAGASGKKLKICLIIFNYSQYLILSFKL